MSQKSRRRKKRGRQLALRRRKRRGGTLGLMNVMRIIQKRKRGGIFPIVPIPFIHSWIKKSLTK